MIWSFYLHVSTKLPRSEVRLQLCELLSLSHYPECIYCSRINWVYFLKSTLFHSAIVICTFWRQKLHFCHKLSDWIELPPWFLSLSLLNTCQEIPDNPFLSLSCVPVCCSPGKWSAIRENEKCPNPDSLSNLCPFHQSVCSVRFIHQRFSLQMKAAVTGRMCINQKVSRGLNIFFYTKTVHVFEAYARSHNKLVF